MMDFLYSLSARIALIYYGQKKSRFHIDLEWFAPEDEGRTEDPTEYKIRKAREEGKVAKSQDLTAAIILLFGVITLAASGTYLLKTMIEMMKFFFLRSAEINIVENGLVFNVFIRYFVRLLLPVGGIVFIAAFLGNVMQVGFLFSVKPITPDIQKIIPKFGNFFKRAFGSSEAAFNLLKSVVKILIIAGIAFLNISAKFDRLVSLSQVTVLEAFRIITSTGFMIMAEAAVVMLAFAIFDYRFQRKKHLDSLKMSKQEVKEERKTQEGDPLIRSRLRERMRQILNQNMLRKVPEADVVVTNPTHFAVAMEWDRIKMHAPTVTAKGQDNMAFRIRDIAKQNGVPVMENKPLTRALFSEVEIGDIIPEKYYEVVALVLAEVYSLNNRQEATG